MELNKLKNLMDSMTLEEKIGQLVQLSGEFFDADDMAVGPKQKLGISQETIDLCGSVLNVVGAKKVVQIQKSYLEKSRHKIPLLFMADIIYGYKTIYPIPLALGCSWNPQMVKQCNRFTSREASAAGAHVTFAPMVDLVRDPRWGRCMESTGEDPYLNGVFAKAMVEGFQGTFEPKESIASCVKHFAAYGAGEGGREYNTVDMSKRRLFQDYLPGYQRAVEAGCEMVMTSFNTVDGIPSSANENLLRNILRDEWNFDGVVIADYAAIQELIAHGVAEDDAQAASLAMKAGVDIDMKTPCYSNHLKDLISDGKLQEDLVDQSVWRILKLKNKLGLFEDPFRGASEENEAKNLCNATHMQMSRQAARESMVLLQNENQVLPIEAGKKIALLGPYANSQDLIGLWAVHGDRNQVISLKTAFEEEKDRNEFAWTRGCEVLDDYSVLGDFGFYQNSEKALTKEEKLEEVKKAIELAKWADVVVFALGEHLLQSGEAGSRTQLNIPDNQMDFLDQILPYVKQSVVLLFNGRPLVLTDLAKKVDAMMECWFPGSQGGHAIVDLLFHKANPSGRLTMSFPYTTGQIPIYYNSYNTGRPMATSIHSNRFMSRYLDAPNEAFYPFGFGLSYHNCEYSKLSLSNTVMQPKQTIQVTVEVTNISDVRGEEVVQLYIRDLVGSVVRPIKELKGFQKITLDPKESKQVIFELNEKMLEFYTADMSYQAEEGKFEVYIGKDSTTQNKEIFVLRK